MPPTNTIPVELIPFFNWIATPVIFGAIISSLLSRIKRFENATPDVKLFWSFVALFLGGVFLYVLRTATPESWIKALEPLFNAGMVMAVPVLAGRLYHAQIKPTDPQPTYDYIPNP